MACISAVLSANVVHAIKTLASSPPPAPHLLVKKDSFEGVSNDVAEIVEAIRTGQDFFRSQLTPSILQAIFCARNGFDYDDMASDDEAVLDAMEHVLAKARSSTATDSDFGSFDQVQDDVDGIVQEDESDWEMVPVPQ